MLKKIPRKYLLFTICFVGVSYLYIQADIVCYTQWQWALVVFAVVWVVPYCAVLYCASALITSCSITPNEFVAVLLCPPVLVVLYVRSLVVEKATLVLSEGNIITHNSHFFTLFKSLHIASTGKFYPKALFKAG